MIADLQQWVEGFEDELRKRFGANLKLVVVNDYSNGIIEKIILAVAQVSGVSYDLIVSEKRGTQQVSDARMVAMYFIRSYFPNYSLTKIAAHFGKRHHSTVINSIKVINTRLEVGDILIKTIVTRAAQKIEEINNAIYDNNNKEI